MASPFNCAVPLNRRTVTSHTTLRLLRISVVTMGLLWQPATTHAEVLRGREFQSLLASGPEGTTILFQGGADRLFYSPTLKNRLRQTPELGADFLKQKIAPKTLAEG